MDYRLGIIYNQQKSDFRKRVAFLLLYTIACLIKFMKEAAINPRRQMSRARTGCCHRSSGYTPDTSADR